MAGANIKGGRKLYTDLIDTEAVKHNRGRSILFNDKRNECLIDRYLYLLLLTDKRYDVILKTVSNEFFISPITVKNVLDANYSQLFALKKEYQGYKEKGHQRKIKVLLSNKWPHLVWLPY